MGQVTISVSGRQYRMACRDGEEKRVLELASFIDGKVQEIKGGLRLVQEDRLFLMAALMMADELLEAREDLQRTLRQLADYRTHQAIDNATASTARETSNVIEVTTASLEKLAAKASRAG